VSYHPPCNPEPPVSVPAALRSPWIAPAALAIACASLAANVALMARLRSPERLAAPAARRVLERLARSDAVIRYRVRIPAGTPLHFDVPVDETYRLRLNTRLPIDTRIQVPFHSPLGNHQVTIPIRADLPIRTDLPVRLRDTFRLRTRTRAEYVIPLELPVRDLPLDDLSEALDARP
jgi:hypothetical protein